MKFPSFVQWNAPLSFGYGLNICKIRPVAEQRGKRAYMDIDVCDSYRGMHFVGQALL